MRRLQALILLWPNLIFSSGLPDSLCLNVCHVTDMWRECCGRLWPLFAHLSAHVAVFVCASWPNLVRNWLKLAMVPALAAIGHLMLRTRWVPADKIDLGNCGHVEVIEMTPSTCSGCVCTSVGREELTGLGVAQLPAILER